MMHTKHHCLFAESHRDAGPQRSCAVTIRTFTYTNLSTIELSVPSLLQPGGSYDRPGNIIPLGGSYYNGCSLASPTECCGCPSFQLMLLGMHVVAVIHCTAPTQMGAHEETFFTEPRHEQTSRITVLPVASTRTKQAFPP